MARAASADLVTRGSNMTSRRVFIDASTTNTTNLDALDAINGSNALSDADRRHKHFQVKSTR